jgi:lysophospholipase L1-like esterase
MMKKQGAFAKLVMINTFVFLVVVLSVNLLASLYLDGRYIWKKIFVPIDEKAYTESLPDQDYTYLIYREKKQLDTRYVPYIAWARKPFSGETTTVNNEGDRVHPSTTDHPLKHVRFFGGSTMWGTGVDDHNTIPAHYNALHQDYRVYNHGESGFVSRQGLERLVNLVNQEALMDVVIFYDGCNDCLSLCRVDVSINGHREEAEMAHKLEHRWQVVDVLVGSIQKLIQKVIKKGERPPSRCRDNPDYAKKVASTLVNNWKIAKSLAAMRGAEFHAILQPVAPLGQPNIEYLEERDKESDWHKVYPFVREIQAKENLSWIHDFTDAFDVKEYIYIDSCHVNGLGNQIIAKRLSERLNHRELLKTGASPYPLQ